MVGHHRQDRQLPKGGAHKWGLRRGRLHRSTIHLVPHQVFVRGMRSTKPLGTCRWNGNHEEGPQSTGRVRRSRTMEVVPSAFLVAALFPGVACTECLDYNRYLKSVGGLDTPDVAEAVAVSGSYAYLACGGSGLMILPAQCSASTSIRLTSFQDSAQPWPFSSNGPPALTPTSSASCPTFPGVGSRLPAARDATHF